MISSERQTNFPSQNTGIRLRHESLIPTIHPSLEPDRREILSGQIVRNALDISLIAQLAPHQDPIDIRNDKSNLTVLHSAQKPSFYIPGAENVLITTAAGMLIVKATDPNPSEFTFDVPLPPGILTIRSEPFEPRAFASPTPNIQEVKKFTGLSDREIEIIESLGWCVKAEEASKILNISSHTYRTHIKNILIKLDFKRSDQILIAGIKWGIINPDDITLPQTRGHSTW